ncbi:MAG TPA: DUF362 domain-containing protein [Syntrophorhabdus sp.]|jgi:uncharacterized protein (DUF362 family)|nr:DUF362 domain-containing protein [Syntrophorhabdus sp.]OQB76707.1 MAG: hypothetical protein BWX92_01551 [Deltaproteobacteria bacterium ADurb.Bin135]NMC95246.1 DUF362 domain-containing protein [Syntrophorhabdus sp.]HNY69347.1 DUF362 domain-containing protein [Syntrophorhabdus sp.]HOH25578.1 DUF362 domain-containing protein [Syntrophorhabdus sp.]
MNRRQFLKALSTSFGIIGMSGGLKHLFSDEPSVLSVAEGSDYAAITRSAIAALGGMQKFVKQGSVVVVKPNLGWDRKPEYAANTHPLVVKTITEECLKAGAIKVKVFDNPCNDPRRCYENSGVADALKGIKNVQLKHMESERYKNVKLNGVFLKAWELYDEALTADVFINVPVAKHHGLTRVSIGLKNIMGIMGGNRGFIHRSIEDALTDVNTVIKSHLTIVDATRILLNHGPQGGDLKDVKALHKVVACRDIVAADAYATTFFGLNPQNISTTVTAYKRGLGEMNLSRIKVIKA